MYQFIINQIPPHETYYEMFLGSGAILRHKKQAVHTYGIDCNTGIINTWKKYTPDWITLFNSNALQVIPTIPKKLTNVFIYLDPPYYYPSRSSVNALYKNEFSNEDHEKLLKIIVKIKHNCMISTYENLLYSSYLSNWRKKEFKVSVHGHPKKEIIYMNYPEPTDLHDYQYLGKNSSDRQRISRKIHLRIIALQKCQILEQKAIMLSLNKSFPGPNSK